MNKNKTFYSFLFVILVFFLLNLNINLEPGQQKPQEEVTVIAVEVPVRVLRKGQLVKDLTREDFEVYENGVKQDITAFEVVSRKIFVPQEEQETYQKKRLFILIFNIFDYNDAVGEGIDYFFENVFRQGDQFIVLTEGRLLDIQRSKNISEVVINIKETLQKFKVISNLYILKTFRELGFESERLLAILRGYEQSQFTPVDQAMIRFFDNFQRAWKDYRRQYLIPDLALYQGIIKRVKQIEGEKWAICFQQREMFPRLKKAGNLDNEIRNWMDSQVDPMEQVKARLVQTKQQELQRALDVSQAFPADGLRDLFLEANITFHLVLLKSFRSVFSQDFELDEIASDYEDCFRKISFSTGGSSAFSNKVWEAIKEATETEDYHYMLVYSPKEDQSVKERDIQVKVNRSGVDVVYLDHVPEIAAPLITITDFEAGRKTIKFSLVNYEMTKIEEKMAGIADVKITIYDEGSNKVFDEGKTLNLTKKETHISLNFNQLKSGRYFIIIQAFDRISQETDVLSRDIKL